MPRKNLQTKGCFICKTGVENKVLMKQIYACPTCTSTFVPVPKPRMWPYPCFVVSVCEICAVEQAEQVVMSKPRICPDCLIACQTKVRASPVPDPKLTFLQQFDTLPRDVSLVVKGSDEHIEAHRFILASKSSVFKTMMEIEMKEKLTGIIHIESVSPAVVQAAVKFLYTGEIEFSDEVSAESMLSFAHQYDIPWLKDLCEVELVERVSTENLLDMLEISYRFETELLKEKVRTRFMTEIGFFDKVLPADVLSFADLHDIHWLKDLCVQAQTCEENLPQNPVGDACDAQARTCEESLNRNPVGDASDLLSTQEYPDSTVRASIQL